MISIMATHELYEEPIEECDATKKEEQANCTEETMIGGGIETMENE